MESTRPPTLVDSLQLDDDIGCFLYDIPRHAVHTSGGFGDIYLGKHRELGKVALKRPRISAEMDKATMERFLREAETWRDVVHPHILLFVGIGRVDGDIYLVSPYMDNGTLSAYLKAYPEADRARLLRETCDAVRFLHQNNVIHGDIKANNILISDDIHALLCDFGLAKPSQSATSHGLKGAGNMRWQPPEVWRNSSRSPKSDVYSFGMTIIEVLTGGPPFADIHDNFAVMTALIIDHKRPSRPAFSPAVLVLYTYLWDVAELCCVTEPENRPDMEVCLPLLEQPSRLLRTRLTMSEVDALVPAAELRVKVEADLSALRNSQNNQYENPSRSSSFLTTVTETLMHEGYETPQGMLTVVKRVNSEKIPPLACGNGGSPGRPIVPTRPSTSARRDYNLHRHNQGQHFFSGLFGIPILISTSTVFEAANFAADLVALPGLVPCIQALEMVYRSIERVSYNRGGCRVLASKATAILYVIRDNAEEADGTKLQLAIDKTNATIQAIRADVSDWSTYSRWTSWYLRRDTARLIQSHEDSLKEATRMIQFAAILQIHNEVKRLQKVLKANPTSAPAYKSAQEQLYNIRKTVDKTSVLRLPQKLACECIKVDPRQAFSGATYDIWEGLWLGRIKVALKLNRDFKIVLEGDDEGKRRMRFERQIDIWRKLDDPYVLKLHGWCKIQDDAKDDDDEIYLVSPWMKNGNIKFYLSRNRNLPVHDLVRLIKEIAMGLLYLHDNRILHGSLQPSNILIDDHGHAVVSDFSLSKLITADAMYTRNNNQTMAFRYQTPEFIQDDTAKRTEKDGGVALSPAADVYCWAMTALEVVSSHPPYYQQSSVFGLMKAVFIDRTIPTKEEHPYAVFEVYPELMDLLNRCWSLDKEKRPSVAMILAELDEMIGR